MSDSPTGPWEWKNYIMKPTQRDRGNHPGICDFKGHSYVFGQNYDLMHLDTYEHHERRTVSATEITYNADGTIQEVPYWMDQKPMKQLHWLNPYRRVEAETMNWGYGLKSAKMGIPNTGVVKDMPESTGKRNMYVSTLGRVPSSSASLLPLLPSQAVPLRCASTALRVRLLVRQPSRALALLRNIRHLTLRSVVLRVFTTSTSVSTKHRVTSA